MPSLDLQKTTREQIVPKLSKELGDLNIFETPYLKKIVVNVGVGKTFAMRRLKTTEQKTDEEILKDIVEGIALISGQRPHLIRSSKSISGFKLREGTVVGLRSTLRRKKMYDFAARLIHISIPRTRDFRGIKRKSVDKAGNLTIGIKDSSVFAELPPGNFNWGFEITMVTNTNNREQALKFFEELGIPFEKQDKKN